MILTLLTPAPAWARSLPLPSTASIPGCSSYRHLPVSCLPSPAAPSLDLL
ncbi:unnamed protein product [Staurois parvus]|uniref:Uncharacterized protein n=1 Tax=Staurois parvus TaxID=386267 RepID=A0ABN9H1C4_9NEOB|nr:unnamed protein product [Staurois parvus]